mmetsp:Transcript_73086/g.230849  ORF Transcript_73086/g.230849 Transcript_73086/m.230849 type:complete len:203 (-) Transcript_73086:429-1037(-)
MPSLLEPSDEARHARSLGGTTRRHRAQEWRRPISCEASRQSLVRAACASSLASSSAGALPPSPLPKAWPKAKVTPAISAGNMKGTFSSASRAAAEASAAALPASALVAARTTLASSRGVASWSVACAQFTRRSMRPASRKRSRIYAAETAATSRAWNWSALSRASTWLAKLSMSWLSEACSRATAASAMDRAPAPRSSGTRE